MSKVEVLCPNGRRVTVRTTPNTKVLQILDEVCAKQGYQPSVDYELRHGRKQLDVVLSVQFSAIPNLAKLELVKATRSRAETAVVIAVQTSGGDRMTRDFLPSVSLWEILESFEMDDGSGGRAKLLHSRIPEEHPVCFYLKDEIIGEYALRETTLRQLGLTSGRAIIRAHFKAITPEDLEEINRNVMSEKIRFAKLLAMGAAQAAADGVNAQSHHTPCVASTAPVDVVHPVLINAPVPSKAKAASTVTVPMDTEDSSRLYKQSDSNSRTQARPEPTHDLVASGRHTNDVNHSHSTPLYWRSEPTQSTPTYRDVRPQSVFADFKFPEETKGKDVYCNELSDFKKEDCTPCDREVVVFQLNESSGEEVVKIEDVPEDFFNVTESDMRVLFNDLQKKTSEYSDQPLMTKSLRRAQREEKLSRYPCSVIRFQFPDGMVVQGIFKPFETVFALYKFVKEHLQDKTLDFELYTAPPKVSLRDHTATLVEAQLVPMTLVYFGLSYKCDQYLCDADISDISTKHRADTTIVKHLPQTSPSTAATGGSTASASRPSTHADRPAGSKASAGNVPKWFKTRK